MAEAQLKTNPRTGLAGSRISEDLHRISGSVVSHGILLLYSALALFPMFLILINSFKNRNDLFRVPYQPPVWFSFDKGFTIINISSTKGYEQVFARADVPKYFGNSLLVTVGALFLILLFG